MPIYPREYAVAGTVRFFLADYTDPRDGASPTLASGDAVVYIDGSSNGNANALPTSEGGTGWYEWTYTAAEATGAQIELQLIDQDGPAWMVPEIIIETYNHPSSQYGTAANVLVSTKIATLTSQTEFTLDAGSADDDPYVGQIAIITDASTNTQKAVGLIESYTGSSKSIVLAQDPGIFTMAANDLVDIIAAPVQLGAGLPGDTGGLPTVDASNLITGIQGTINDFDGAITATARAILPQTNTAYSNIEFLMVSAADGRTPLTGLSPSGTVSIDGAAFTAVTGSIAEIGNGIYQFDADAADMNGSIMTFRFTGTNAQDRFVQVRAAD